MRITFNFIIIKEKNLFKNQFYGQLLLNKSKSKFWAIFIKQINFWTLVIKNIFFEFY